MNYDNFRKLIERIGILLLLSQRFRTLSKKKSFGNFRQLKWQFWEILVSKMLILSYCRNLKRQKIWSYLFLFKIYYISHEKWGNKISRIDCKHVWGWGEGWEGKNLVSHEGVSRDPIFSCAIFEHSLGWCWFHPNQDINGGDSNIYCKVYILAQVEPNFCLIGN